MPAVRGMTPVTASNRHGLKKHRLKSQKSIAALARLTPASLMLILLSGCPTAETPTAETPTETVAPVPPTAAESWQCRNDLEVRCGEGECEAEAGDGFTPMSVSFDDSGAISVCAYSGCWEGHGEAITREDFLVLIGHDLAFSTAPDSESGADVVIATDRSDGVATLKVGEFAHPLLCAKATGV